METRYRLDAWLPTTKKEVEARGWDYLDVIIFSGDAYVDHPSFGAAVIGRVLEAEGLRVAIVPQPDWRGDYRDFKKLGAPRLFFGVSAGAMDSMVNHYTANRRLRSDDAYTPDRRSGMRPDYPSVVYARILKELYPDVPVVLGGIEASLRRLTHYDYWKDRLLPGILVDSPADLLIYGMGELPIRELVARLRAGEPFHEIRDIRQTVYMTGPVKPEADDILLFSHEECLRDKLKQAKNFRHIEEEHEYGVAHHFSPEPVIRVTQQSGNLLRPVYIYGHSIIVYGGNRVFLHIQHVRKRERRTVLDHAAQEILGQQHMVRMQILRQRNHLQRYGVDYISKTVAREHIGLAVNLSLQLPAHYEQYRVRLLQKQRFAVPLAAVNLPQGKSFVKIQAPGLVCFYKFIEVHSCSVCRQNLRQGCLLHANNGFVLTKVVPKQQKIQIFP